jgi:hypothetical protein
MLDANFTFSAQTRTHKAGLATCDGAAISLSQNRRILLFLLLLLAFAEFMVRGPIRIVMRAGDYNDYTSSYVGAKAWIKGLNPYSNDVFWDLWKQSSSVDLKEEESIGSRTPYPWTCFLLLSPLSLLTARTASMLMGLISSALILLSLGLLTSLSSLAKDRWRQWIFLGLALAMAPFHSGLGQMNISMPAIAFVFASFWAASTEKSALAGFFCAISVGLKPPIGVFFAVYYIFSRQWKAFGATVGTTLMLAAVAIGRLQWAGVPWLSSYLANSKLVLSDPINAITAANPKRFQMINLQVLWYSLTKNERIANELAVGIASLLLLALIAAVLRKSNAPASLQVSAFAAICLLPVYHRFYDASLLVFPLFWSLSNSSEATKPYRRLVLLLLLPFAFPGAWALETLQNARRIPVFLTEKWWWEPVVLGHEIWAILLLALLLVIANLKFGRVQDCSTYPVVQRGNPA